jgi:hypothetical protein
MIISGLHKSATDEDLPSSSVASAYIKMRSRIYIYFLVINTYKYEDKDICLKEIVKAIFHCVTNLPR